MPDVFIITDVVEPGSQVSGLSIAQAMKQAILPKSDTVKGKAGSVATSHVEVLAVNDLGSRKAELRDQILCPLTLNLPEWLAFPGQAMFAACAEVQSLRDLVADWQYGINAGNYWLPLVVTAKGVLFGEVIAQISRGAMPAYHQPFHLVDAQRQSLYELGQRLLRSLSAPPGVYLLQFGLLEHRIEFDRLIPFPDLPAIASVNVQTPNLFQCHWACLTNQPIRDLWISSSG